MNIEFQTPPGKVKEWVISFVRDKLMALHRKEKEISRAQVYLREPDAGSNSDKVCEIDLTIYGNSLFVHRNAGSFEQAARDVVDELTEKINELAGKQNEPPDETTSTVNV